MKKIITIIGLFLTLALFGKPGMRTDCPIKLSEQEIKTILENHAYFVKRLEEVVDIGDKNQAPYDLRCTDLRTLPLSQRKFTNFDLRGSLLDDTSLFNGVLEFVDLSNTSLKNADLSRTQFWDCKLDNADFNPASLEGSNFIGIAEPISAQNANFKGANISSTAAMKNVDLSGALFDDADLSNSGFENIIINDKTSFKNTDLTMAQLTNWTGQTGDLKTFLLGQNAKLAGAVIDGTDTDISFGA